MQESADRDCGYSSQNTLAFVYNELSAITAMSEYQYYEFQAVDRPLSASDREALRRLSTRARITATSFTNSYEWGDFKGDPVELMERWFDLHVYVANWGTHRLMIRLPKRLVDHGRLDDFLGEVDCVELRESGENLILDVLPEETEPEDDWDDGTGWFAALAPLRGDVLGGDLRLFYLLWLTAVEADALPSDAVEPLPGIGPVTGAIEALAQFLRIDDDLVAAAAENSPAGETASTDAARRIIPTLPDREKTELLIRVAEGDPHVRSEIQALIRKRSASKSDAEPVTVARRTVGELRARAEAIRDARARADAEKAAAERKRQAEEEARARRARLDAIEQRGEGVWREIETEIGRGNASAYDRAAGLLVDLKAIAEKRGTIEEFSRRLSGIRERYVRKVRFIERLTALG